MKNLFDATVANQVKTRLGKLEPKSERGWGRMTAAQMLAHCSVSMQWAVGDLVPEKGALPARLMGQLVKSMVFRNEDPLRKNSPTAKSLIVADERYLGEERDQMVRKFWKAISTIKYCNPLLSVTNPAHFDALAEPAFQ